MQNKTLYLFITAVLIVVQLSAQQKKYPIRISYEKNVAGDTIYLSVNKPADTKPGSLLVIATPSSTTRTDTIFFPVLDTVNTFVLVLPPFYASKKIKLTAIFNPGIFKIAGKVVDKIKDEEINALVITDNQRIYNKKIIINKTDNQFILPPLVFEEKASLVFNYLNRKKKDHPDIIIRQYPTVEEFTDTILSETITLRADSVIKNQTEKYVVDTSSTYYHPKNIELNTVTVKGIKKSRAEKFNEENSSGLFNDASEKVIDCLDNDDALSFPDCLSYISTKVAGIRIDINKMGENSIYWRGHETKAFFIDEIAVDIDQLLSTPVSDIAIIKAYPPPFFGSGGSGNGGAIAVYTRKGEYRRPGTNDKKWLFPIKGYSKAIHVLFQ